jgi:hypothetical protein
VPLQSSAIIVLSGKFFENPRGAYTYSHSMTETCAIERTADPYQWTELQREWVINAPEKIHFVLFRDVCRARFSNREIIKGYRLAADMDLNNRHPQNYNSHQVHDFLQDHTLFEFPSSKREQAEYISVNRSWILRSFDPEMDMSTVSKTDLVVAIRCTDGCAKGEFKVDKREVGGVKLFFLYTNAGSYEEF